MFNKKVLFGLLIAATGLAIAGVAAYFSVSGISKVYAGAATAIIILAGTLEFGKIIVASILNQYWDTLSKMVRSYLIVGLTILMIITSAGIYGFLTSAYKKTSDEYAVNNRAVSVIESRKDIFTTRLKESEEELKIIRADIVDKKATLSNIRNNRDTISSVYVQKRTAKSLQKEITDMETRRDKELTPIVTSMTDSINRLDNNIATLKAGNEASAELGPLIYLSDMTGKPMDTIVNWFTILIVLVFDPLAIALILVFNSMFKNGGGGNKKNDGDTVPVGNPIVVDDEVIDTEDYFDIIPDEINIQYRDNSMEEYLYTDGMRVVSDIRKVSDRLDEIAGRLTTIDDLTSSVYDISQSIGDIDTGKIVDSIEEVRSIVSDGSVADGLKDISYELSDIKDAINGSTELKDAIESIREDIVGIKDNTADIRNNTNVSDELAEIKDSIASINATGELAGIKETITGIQDNISDIKDNTSELAGIKESISSINNVSDEIAVIKDIVSNVATSGDIKESTETIIGTINSRGGEELEAYGKNIDTIMTEIENIKGDDGGVSKLVTEIKTIREEISTITSDVNGMGSGLKELRGFVNTSSDTITGIGEDITNIKSTMDGITSEIEILHDGTIDKESLKVEISSDLNKELSQELKSSVTEDVMDKLSDKLADMKEDILEDVKNMRRGASEIKMRG